MASVNSSPKKIIFKCDQHAAIISEKLQTFYKQNEFFDTVLKAGRNGVSIQAHRVILCALSEYFLEVFRGNPAPALKGNVMELKEINASTLKLIIDFMYTGSIELSLGTVGGVLRTASFLKIKSLVDGCCELIESNIDCSNSLSWFRLAYELSLPGLRTKALECIYTHFEAISKEKELLMLSENELKDLLFNDNPNGDFEEDVFRAMVEWINYDKPNREHLVFQLLSMVRFQALTPKFIVENRKAVCKTVESYELICSWLQWHLSPETLPTDQQNCVLRPKRIKKELVVIQRYGDERITINTFNPEAKSWSMQIDTLIPLKIAPLMIAIDGKLIVAGRTNIENLDSVKYFDLHTSEWIEIAPMKNGRCIWFIEDLKAIFCVAGTEILSNSKIYCVHVYNFSTREWHGMLPLSKISQFTEIAIHNEMLYLLDLHFGTLQSYNAFSNKWTFKTIKEKSFNYFGLAALEGFLYIIGGKSTAGWVKTVKRYDLSNNCWSEMASLPHALENPSVKTTVSGNQTIIVNDGCYNYEYSLDSDTWTTLNPLKADIPGVVCAYKYINE